MEHIQESTLTVFISYAREDSEFVFQLKTKLESRNIKCMGDWDLTAAANFHASLTELNLASLMFLFVISPDSVRSAECKKEIALAVENKKLILPISYRDHGDDDLLDKAIRTPQWLFIKEISGIEKALPEIEKALRTDFELMRVHSSLILAVNEWNDSKRRKSYLLKKDKLKEAERWLQEVTRQPLKLPQATPQQIEFVVESRRLKIRSARVLLATVISLAAIFLFIAVYALFAKQTAEQKTKEGLSLALSSQSYLAQFTSKDITMGFRYAQYALKMDSNNLDAQIVLYASAIQNESQPKRYYYSKLFKLDDDRFNAFFLPGNSKYLDDQIKESITLISGSDTIIRKWNTLINGRDTVLVVYDGDAPSKYFRFRVYSQDDRYFFDFKYQGMVVNNAITGKKIREITGHAGIIRSAQSSKDGNFVLTASDDKTAAIWDINTGYQIAALGGHTDGVLFASFSPDEKRIITSSQDKTARIWIDKDIMQVYAVQFEDEVPVFSSDLNKCLFIKEEKGEIMDITNNKRISVLEGNIANVESASFSGDSRQVIINDYDNSTRIWDVSTGKQVAAYNDFATRKFSPNGIMIFKRFFQKANGIENIENKNLMKTLKNDTGYIAEAALSHNKKMLLTIEYKSIARNTGDSGVVKLWDVLTGRVKYLLKPRIDNVIYDIGVFSPKNQYFITSLARNTVGIFDAETGKLIFRLAGHAELVTFADYSPDGTKVITVSMDKTAIIWDARTGKPLTRLIGHTSGIGQAEFSPDGKRIITAGADNTARLWDVATGKSILVLEGMFDESPYAAFSSDGKRVLTRTDRMNMKIWLISIPDIIEGLNNVIEDLPIEEKKKYGIPTR